MRDFKGRVGLEEKIQLIFKHRDFDRLGDLLKISQGHWKTDPSGTERWGCSQRCSSDNSAEG